jgi:hypothetical protein
MQAVGVYNCYVVVRVFLFYYTGIRLDSDSGLNVRKESEINITYFFASWYMHRYRGLASNTNFLCCGQT